MGPRKDVIWEFWSLGLWWAIWSLGDAYLLPYSPWAELGVVGACVLVAAATRLGAWLRDLLAIVIHPGGKRYASHTDIHEGSAPVRCRPVAEAV